MNEGRHLPQLLTDIPGSIERFVTSTVRRSPFLVNFESAVRGEDRFSRRIAERLLLDITDPSSNVSFILICGLPGSGKTTFINEFCYVVNAASLGVIRVEKRSFTQYRNKAIADLKARNETWTKEKETQMATEYMKREALRAMQQGPILPNGVRRIIVAEMPVYPVDRKERGLSLVRALGEAQKSTLYHKRRARVIFVKPDVDVIKNAMVTRLLNLSFGGSADVLYEIAEKAYAGAFLFNELNPKTYRAITQIIKDRNLFDLICRNSLRKRASKIIALRMLSILAEAGLYGSLDTVVMNPSTRNLKKLSMRSPHTPRSE